MISFNTLENWFGNRGYEIKPNWFKEFGIYNDFIWWKSNKSAPDWLASNDPNMIVFCSYKSSYFEIIDEVKNIVDLKK